MKLLLDQNISYKLVDRLHEFFPNSAHVYTLGLHTHTDTEIWEYALTHDFTIVTQDADFNERSVLYGHPPKIIWLRTGNVSTRHIFRLLYKHHKRIAAFEKDTSLSCIILID